MTPQVKLIIICGLSFSGKSTLGDAIADAFGYPQADVDETMRRLYGSDVEDADLSPKQWDRIYTETDILIASYLRHGRSVVDASRSFRKVERDTARGLADGCNAATVVIHVDTPEAVARERWQQNRRTHSRRDVSDQDFEEIISVMEPPADEEDALIFHHQDDLSRWLAQHRRYLITPTQGS